MVILVLFYNEETEAEKLSNLVKVTTQLMSDDLILELRKSDCRDHALSSNLMTYEGSAIKRRLKDAKFVYRENKNHQ